MVNIVENWADIEGKVEAISDNPDLPDYYLVDVKLEVTSDVEGFPNLAKADEGKTIRINVPKAEMGKHHVVAGGRISCSVRKSFGQVYFIR